MMQPDDIEILNDLGALLTRLGLPAEAIPFLEHAIAISPSYAEAQVNLGTAYGKVGRYEEGLRALQEAKRLRGSASL
jgi:tetratricopeptide (TPR) repeat protein